jgi:hypothetical protein
MESPIAEAPAAPFVPEGPGLALALNEEENAGDSMSGDTGEEEASGAPESTDEPEATGEPESGTDVTEAEDEGPPVSTDIEDEFPSGPPKAGYLVFPDNTAQPIPPSQWLIGRADLAKFLPDPDKATEISRGHLTVFQEGERFFVEDGSTMVQRRASANKTWLVRRGTRILVTGTGRNELQDADEIDVAELVKLQFVVK